MWLFNFATSQIFLLQAGSFGADVIATSVGLQWVGWCEAIQIVIGSSISPVVGRLSDM